jgi:membrane protein implicated in regulation of membrane protease activity
MSLLYTICAVVGGTLFLLQFLITLLGFGGHDAGAHFDVHHSGGDAHGGSWLMGMFSFRAVVAALTAFGLGGLAAHASGAVPALSLSFAVFCAVASMFIVALMNRSMRHLEDDGTVRIEQAVGRTGTVYLTIPAQKAGTGKVTLSLQNRTVELSALTPRQALPTGTKVVVTAVLGTDTVEVAIAPDALPLAPTTESTL